MVRSENVLATAMQVFSITALMTVLWMLCGYSLAFAPATADSHSGGLYGDFSRLFLMGMQPDSVHQLAPTIPEPAFCLYQLTFAIAAPALMCGSFAERTRYTPILVFMGIYQILVYCPLAHCFWHPDGFLYKLGVMDTAGGAVIHTAAGVASLACIKIIGNRRMRDDNFREQFEPHDILFTVIGACMMWAAWFGFNAGGAQGGSAATICLATQISASMASFSWLFTEWYHRGDPSVLGMVNGGVAGLTCITPASGFVDAQGAFCIGLIGGVAVYYGIRLKNLFGFDDAIDAFGVNATGGILGMLFTAVFATKTVCPYSGFVEGGLWVGLERLGVQSLAVVFTVLWSGVISLISLVIIDETMGLRVTALEERLGLDVALHHETIKHGQKSVFDGLMNVLDSRDNSRTPSEVDVDDHYATEDTLLEPGELLYVPSNVEAYFPVSTRDVESRSNSRLNFGNAESTSRSNSRLTFDEQVGTNSKSSSGPVRRASLNILSAPEDPNSYIGLGVPVTSEPLVTHRKDSLSTRDVGHLRKGFSALLDSNNAQEEYWETKLHSGVNVQDSGVPQRKDSLSKPLDTTHLHKGMSALFGTDDSNLYSAKFEEDDDDEMPMVYDDDEDD